MTPSDETVTEPADPEGINHDTRRQTRIAPTTFDTNDLPKPLVECGCGNCSDAADPLAGESEVWRDSLWASELCPQPRPMTVERAATAYRVYQTASYNAPSRQSAYERVRNQHGRLMDAERDLLDDWDSEVTTVLLSLRLSPVEDVPIDTTKTESMDEGSAYYGPSVGRTTQSQNTRRWIPPVQLDNRLHDPWRNVYDTLRHHLDDYEWEYVAVVSTTESAATPHLHIYLWVRDPEDDIATNHVQPAVSSFVRNATGAHSEHHPVEDGESDAAVIRHDPPTLDIDDEQALHVYRERGEKAFKQNTRGLGYVLHQRPEWSLRPLVDESCNTPVDDVQLQGGAIAWASPNKWLMASSGISVSE